MTWFIIIGVAGIVSLALALLTRLRWWWRAAIGVALPAMVVVIARNTGGLMHLGPGARWYDETPSRELILFLVMLLGMIARMLSLAIEQRRTRVDAAGPSAAAASASALRVDAWEFVYPMLFAVPTFGALLSQVPADALSIAALTLAFQTGFFWQTILKRGAPA